MSKVFSYEDFLNESKLTEREYKTIAFSIYQCLSGRFSEDEEGIIKIFKDKIKTKEDFDQVETIWNTWWPGSEWFGGQNRRAKTLAGLEKAMDQTKEHVSGRTGLSGLSLRNAIIKYFNKSQLSDLNAVLPAGVVKISKKDPEDHAKYLAAHPKFEQVYRKKYPLMVAKSGASKGDIVFELQKGMDSMYKNPKVDSNQLISYIEKFCKDYRAKK